MTLQRIDRVEVEDWRNWQGVMTLPELPAGLVVLAGPNALGKTGVWEAIVAALLDRHWGTHTERLRPAGTKGVLPRVRVDFLAAGTRYRVEKHFGGTRDRAEFHELVNGEWVLRDKGEEAYLLSRRATLGGDESAPTRGGPDKALGDTLMEVLLAAQGRLAADAPAPGAVSIAVTDREAADTATHIGRLLSAVGRQCDEFWVGKRDRLRKGTDLAGWKDRLGELETAIPSLEAKAREIDTLVSRLAEVGDTESDREVAEARNEEANGLRAEVKAHREAREAARKAEQESGREKDAAERLLADRTALRDRDDEARRQVEKALHHQQETADGLRRLDEGHRQETDRRNRRAEEVTRLQQWISHEERGGRLEHLKERLAGVRDRMARAEEAGRSVAELEAELGSLQLPTREEWTEWDGLQARMSQAEGALKAGAWTVTGRIPAGLDLTVDGVEVGDGTVDTEATRDVTLAGDDGSSLRMEAPRGSAERFEDVTREVRSFLGRFGVDDITELRKRNEYVLAELERSLALARQKRADALRDESPTDLLRDELELSDRIQREEAGAAPGSERPDGRADLWKLRLEDLEVDLAEARERVESGGQLLGSARERFAEAEQAAKTRQEDLELAGSMLAEHRAEYGTDEELRASRQRWAAEHEARLADWRRFEDARPMAEEAKESRADGLSAGLSEILARQRKIQRLEAEVEALRREDPAAELAARAGERADLDPRVAAEETKANALRLLERVLADEKQRVTHAIGQPVRDRVQNWVTYLLQDESRVEVDECGRPMVVSTPAGQQVPLADQSFGTREQLSVLYRLAVADLVAGEAGSGVCLMFDDPFGHTDKLRRSRMLDILSAEAERRGHQILLFTCRPEDFAGVGHPVALTTPVTSE